MFDLKKFQQNVNRELKRQYPDRTRLETQCMTSLAFVKNDDDLLNCPCWVLVINIVALDMLKGKLMPGERRRLGRGGIVTVTFPDWERASVERMGRYAPAAL